VAATASDRRASSSVVQLIFPVGLMRFRYWKWRNLGCLPKKTVERRGQVSEFYVKWGLTMDFPSNSRK